MSFREVRLLQERLSELSCPLAVSLDAFRLPNFELMARVLRWLLHWYVPAVFAKYMGSLLGLPSYEPGIDLPPSTNDQEARVAFLRSAVLFLAVKAQVKVNSRRLYQADGYAVRELLKVADLLHEAHTLSATVVPDATSADKALQSPASKSTRTAQVDMSSRLPQIKRARELASKVTELGAELFDRLERELEYLRDNRYHVISRPVNLAETEQAVKQQLRQMTEQIAATQAAMENLQGDEGNLTSKIEKKKLELERREKRLKSLQSVRPAYMDEFERLEGELAKLYPVYVDKHRNLSYLEQQLDEVHRIESGKAEETEQTLKRMQERLKQEELKMLGGRDDDDTPSDMLDMSDTGMNFPLGSGLGIGSQGRHSENRMSHSLSGDESDEGNEEDMADDDDDDDGLNGENFGDLGDDDEEDDDDDADELMAAATAHGHGLYGQRGKGVLDSDEEEDGEEEDEEEEDSNRGKRGDVDEDDDAAGRLRGSLEASGMLGDDSASDQDRDEDNTDDLGAGADEDEDDFGGADVDFSGERGLSDREGEDHSDNDF
ncbi:hypothetical protein RI367_006247 [Sorochytrium milnesiophthora]